ncbi:MAG TPA: hypothetical protein VE980_20855 [Pyrinomonadaceae bacterium]|nr:hypothetical protein [Pyrinomonadaceae bacterium]
MYSSAGKFLALAFLFLGLTAQLSAAQRDDEQSLQGLKNIEVVVKFGRMDGNPEKWHANILLTLEGRAKKKLAEAGVPLYQSTDEAGTAVRPRLIFILSLNSVTTTAPPVRVATQLFQRARLSRDAAKELEVPTWVMYGVGGPMVTPQMVFDVFDGQVDLFIKTYNAANPASSEVSRQTTPDASAQLCDTAGTFAGLSSTRIYVSFRRDQFTDARRVLLEKFVQEAAETKLKEAGIKLTRYTNEEEKTGNARLSLYVKLSEPNVHLWDPPVGVESKFYQTVRLVRDPRKQTEAMTWESYDTGQFVKNDSGKLTLTDEVILDVINRQIDEFIKVFKAANNQR